MFKELKQRNVFKAGAAYVLIAWLLLQLCSIAFPALLLPAWALTLATVFLVLGLPVVLVSAWAFELTPDGLKSESTHVPHPLQNFLHSRQIDFAIIGLLSIALAFFVVDKYVLGDTALKNSKQSGVAEVGEPEPSKEVGTERPSKSIAVLPFVNMSDDKDYFADGLSEEILNLLAKTPELKVAGRTSSFAFKGRNEDLREIGQALDVATVLEGSVRRSGVTLRITAQLINVADGYHIWSEVYERELTDVFEVQDDIAAKIMTALEIHLGTAVPDVHRPTENMVAYEKFLAAKALSQGQFDTLRPIDLLKEAVALDPGFAEAWEFLAIEYWTRGGGPVPMQEAAVLTLDAAEKALALDPTLSIAAAMEVSANPIGFTWARETLWLEKAWQEFPNSPLLSGALIDEYLIAGYFSDALPIAEHWIINDPLSALAQWTYSVTLRTLGRDDEAIAVSRRALDLGEPLASFDLFTAHIVSGELDVAIKDYEDYLKAIGRGISGVDAWVRGASDPITGRQFLLESVENENPLVADEPWAMFLAFGHMDDFFDELERDIDPDKIWNEADAIMMFALPRRPSGVSSHPRYVPAMKALGVADLWDERGPPDRCKKVAGKWSCE